MLCGGGFVVGMGGPLALTGGHPQAYTVGAKAPRRLRDRRAMLLISKDCILHENAACQRPPKSRRHIPAGGQFMAVCNQGPCSCGKTIEFRWIDGRIRPVHVG